MKSLFILAVALVSFAGVAMAGDYKVGAIEIERPWARATPKGASVAAGYLKITNKGTTPDRLTGGSVTFAKRVEVHEMAVIDGIMRMRELKPGLDIKPGETVELKPGSFHLMFMEPTAQLMPGQTLKGTLNFEKAGAVDIEFTVEAMGATPGGPHKMSH